MAVVQMEPADLAAGSFAVPMGPMASLPLSVFAPGVEYEFSARLRLMTTGRGEGGTPPSACSRGVTDSCPYLALQRRVDFASPWDYKRLGPQTPSPAVDGTWYEYSFQLNFTEHLPDLASYGERYVYFQGAEAGVELALDNFDVKEFVAPPPPPPSSGPTAGPTAVPLALSDSPTSAPAPVCREISSLSFDDSPPSGLGPGSWYANYYYHYGSNPEGAPHNYTDVDSHQDSNTYALLHTRTRNWQGLRFVLPLDCLVVGPSYEVTAKVRLSRPDGESTLCDSSDGSQNCLYLTLYKEDLDPDNDDSNLKDYDAIGREGKIPSKTNVWYNFSATFSFGPEILDSALLGGDGVVARQINFMGPEAGVDIAFDDLHFGLVDTAAPTSSPTSQPTPEGYLPPVPSGPYVTAAESSEMVIIPDPETPTVLEGSDRTGCPHEEPNLLDWHDTDTWTVSSLPVPVAGYDVTLPPSSRVLVSESVVGTLGLVTIPATSELIFGENEDGINFDAAGIDVRGALTAGSETCRLEGKLTVTLHGSRPTDLGINGTSATTAVTHKGVIASGDGARLDLHGRRYHRTWTRLAKTLAPGDRVVLLQHAVNWKVGQEIVLVTTAMKDSRDWHQNEVFTIKALVGESSAVPEGVGTVVYLDGAVEHAHVTNGNYQAEVGLLTRDIVVRGSAADSEPSQTDDGTYTDRSVFGNDGAPDPTKDLDGFGGHIMIKDGGLGFVEGVELYRMGQTNVLGRYPMHFHLLGDGCAGCYFKDSAVHRSFYRCVSIHGTHNLTISENVGYDVTGYCYYLEDGVEEDNTLSFNLAALVHFLGTAPWGGAQETAKNYQSKDMILPADVTAAGFYITNVHNDVIGNAASGGWAGFAFPVLHEPLGPHRTTANMRPSSRTSKTIDGNTAHSAGWWWNHAGAFYSGGSLYYDDDGLLVYNAGRDQSKARSPCLKDWCAAGNCGGFCQPEDQAWLRISNSKAFLNAGTGLNSWTGRMEIVGYEAHDNGLALEALQDGFWVDRLLAVCRSGEAMIRPPGGPSTWLKGNGFFWYDTNQEHIITNSVFRNCGYRWSDENAYDQYDSSPTRGCYTEEGYGCSARSTVFGFLTHSDKHNPEIMQATKNVTFQNCGRRFYLFDFNDYKTPPPNSTVSGRLQNWLDVDGSVSGLGEPTLTGSGLADAGLWWNVEEDATYDTHGPLWFIKQNNGPNRNLGHVRLEWDAALHDLVGKTDDPLGICPNGGDQPCDAVGHIKHFGPRFAQDAGLPVTGNPDVAGPTGGYGWLFELDGGAPVDLKVRAIEVDPDTPLLLGVQYPPGTNFTITANAYPGWCTPSSTIGCVETFRSVPSRAEVRNSIGNVYHVDSATGFLTLRIIMFPKSHTGRPDWTLFTYDTVGKSGNVGTTAIDSFTREGVTLPKHAGTAPWLGVRADCPSEDGVFCSDTPSATSPAVCSSAEYEQVSYDKCCLTTDLTVCEDAAQG